MNDIKLFEKWIKKSLENRLIFKNLKDEYLLTDAYVAFKINKKLKEYKRVIEEQTFQTLEKDFEIYQRKITIKEQPDIKKTFSLENKTEAIRMPFVYDDGYKLRIFKIKNETIFVQEKMLSNINLYDFEVYGSLPGEALIFHSEFLDYVALPVRICSFDFEILKKQDKENENENM